MSEYVWCAECGTVQRDDGPLEHYSEYHEGHWHVVWRLDDKLVAAIKELGIQQERARFQEDLEKSIQIEEISLAEFLHIFKLRLTFDGEI